MTDLAFEPFAKIARLSRQMVVTEKLDGTNAQVLVGEDGSVRAGSRNRWLTVEDDNFGFARWVADNADALRELGPGRHYGEWWGSGIQRRYGLAEKRFSLFNVSRWAETRPSCCHVVPVLCAGMFDTAAVDAALEDLRINGSRAAPGFAKPEGLIVYHVAANLYFKKTLDKNDGAKGTPA